MDDDIVQHYDTPWPRAAPITGQGRIAGTTVPYVSMETPLAMHSDYTLPDGQLQDLVLLRGD